MTTRRRFLSVLGVGAGAAALGTCIKSEPFETSPPVPPVELDPIEVSGADCARPESPDGETVSVRTVFVDCPVFGVNISPELLHDARAGRRLDVACRRVLYG